MADGKVMTYGEARRIARKLAEDTLEHYWTPGKFPVDPIKIARKCGIEIYDSQLGKDRWGMLIGGDNSATMYLDVDQPPSRKRFSAAHELGHYMTHSAAESFDGFEVKPIKPGEGYEDARSDQDRGNVFEVIANEFAGNLLMPEGKFRELKENGNSDIAIASFFKVSVDAVSYRSRRLGLA